MSDSPVLIAGCGYVGSALAARLQAAGRRVVGLRRSEAPLPPGVVALRGDVTRPATLTSLPDDIGAVCYAVAADAREDGAYERAYVRGVAGLLEALASRRIRPSCLLFVSSTAVYAQDDGSVVDEDSPTEPRHFSGRRLLEGEALARSAPFPGIVLRLGGIYGPGRTSLLDQVRSGRAAVAPGGPRYTNRIHRDDAAAAIQHLLGLVAPAACFVGVDCDPAPQAEVLAWLAGRLGAPPPPVREPAPGSRRAAGNRRCSNRRLLQTGYRFLYPSYRDGYAALIEASG